MNILKRWLLQKICSFAVGTESPFNPEEYMATIAGQQSFMLPMQKKINACQNIELAVFKDTKEGKEEIKNHMLNPMFNMINPNTSFNEFLDYFLVWYEGYSNGVLLEIVRGMPTRAPDMYIYNPQNFSVQFEGRTISKIEIFNPHRIITGDALKDYMWIRSPNYRNIIDGVTSGNVGQGYSKHWAFAIWGAYSRKAWEWNWSLAKNLGKPGGILTADDYVDPDDRAEIQTKMEASNGGADNAGKYLVLGSGLKYQDASKNPIDSDWSTGEQRAHERAAIACNVPAELVGGGESTYQNRKHAKKELYREGVIPFFNNLCKWLNYLLRDYLKNGEKIDYKLSGADELKEDIGEVIERLDKVKDRLTINEYRRLLNELADFKLPDIDGGDVMLIGNMTLDELTEPTDPAKEKEEDI
ncbi:phage portal protein [uncultured Fusobacterium sp.]|uniref:phage portal protein n=1 Tax=uncultured Fusobacterium sp. TaxID=159267 RepID=UPI0027DB6000|nr:phage portal protein [uncultured Fusobacterium sp.]